MNDCTMCNGDGIMIMLGSSTIKAPCIICSRDKTLEFLEARNERERELKAIHEHNERMKANE